MPPVNHAVLSASAAHRWLACPPSAMLEKELPDETTVYAEEGSVAHEVAEYKVRWYLGERDIPTPSIGSFNAEEIDRYTDSYAYYVTDKIETIRKSCPDAIVLVEQKLDFSNYVKDGFGTGDLVIVVSVRLEPPAERGRSLCLKRQNTNLRNRQSLPMMK